MTGVQTCALPILGILPAVSDAQTLILADKLVHASIIDAWKADVPVEIRPAT